MTHEHDRIVSPISRRAYTRRAVLKGELAVGVGTLAVSASGGGLLTPEAAAAGAAGNLKSGAVYTMTNQPTGNAVVAFHRTPDGTLTLAGVFPTGGRGSGGFDQSQNALVLSGRPGADVAQRANQLLFATNAGSNEIMIIGESR